MKKIFFSLVILILIPSYVFALTETDKKQLKAFYYYALQQGFDNDDAKQRAVDLFTGLAFERFEQCQNKCLSLGGNLYFTCIEKCPSPNDLYDVDAIKEAKQYLQSIK